MQVQVQGRRRCGAAATEELLNARSRRNIGASLMYTWSRVSVLVEIFGTSLTDGQSGFDAKSLRQRETLKRDCWLKGDGLVLLKYTDRHVCKFE